MLSKNFLIRIDFKLFQSLLIKIYRQYHYKKFFASKIQYRIEINYNKQVNYLDTLAAKYGTNKGGYGQVLRGSEYFTSLTYTYYYDLLFRDIRHSIKKVFECGIGTNNINLPSNMGENGKPGASLLMWKDYFPNADIYGADIDRSILFSENRLKTYFIDQSKADSVVDFWHTVGETEFDLIIDDGLHRFEAGRTLFLNSIEKLAKSGVYIIEDVTHDNLIKYFRFFSDGKYTVNYIKFYSPQTKPGQDSNNNIIEIRKS